MTRRATQPRAGLGRVSMSLCRILTDSAVDNELQLPILEVLLKKMQVDVVQGYRFKTKGVSIVGRIVFPICPTMPMFRPSLGALVLGSVA